MENNNQIIAAPIKNRFFAFLIDAFCVYLIRFFYIMLSLNFWLGNKIIDFTKKYELLYGKFNVDKLTLVELAFILDSPLFKNIIFFIAGAFLLSMLYNGIFFSTKWSATIGQKLLGIYVVSKDGGKISSLQIIFRSILTMVPWIFIFFVMCFKLLFDFGMPTFMTKEIFVIAIILFLTWYDLIFFTKNKLVFHDLLTSTRVVVRHPEEYEDNSNSLWRTLFPDVREMYKNLKTFATEQYSKAKEMKAKYKEEKEKNKK